MLNINAANLYKAFRDFHTLTNIRIVLFDKTGQILLAYPESKSEFCTIIGKDATLDQRCADCDYANFKLCSQAKQIINYRCHLGLSEAIVPIYDTSGILGFIMFGQVLMQEGAKLTREKLHREFNDTAFPGIHDAIDALPVKTTAELEATTTILQALVSYLLSNQWVTPARSEFIRHMDSFIEANLDKTITVNDICAEFHIKRTRLYSIASEYLGCSIATYIRNQRIAHACRLLKDTDMSVSSIAYAVGFSDYGHFSRIFQQLQGKSATAYRRSQQKYNLGGF
ncbi:MAG: PocR ligand-binding domain-containing protein [Clostridia bacterium]|nr:PocR ligand-binding domain-containing protein [Clostridia bacterium]